MRQAEDLSGKRFGMLVALSRADNVNSHPAFLCKCDCGQSVVRNSHYLKRAVRKGIVPACGCTRQAARRNNGLANRSHGKSVGVERKLYDVWRQMHRRCYDKACKDFPAWGGRGILVCPEWHDVVSFCAWAKVSGYRTGLTIERTDNNAGYSPGNCRWIENSLQAKNTRRVKPLSAFGKTMMIADWVEWSGIKYRTILMRINLGWPVERAVTEKPVKGKNQFGG